MVIMLLLQQMVLMLFVLTQQVGSLLCMVLHVILQQLQSWRASGWWRTLPERRLSPVRHNKTPPPPPRCHSSALSCSPPWRRTPSPATSASTCAPRARSRWRASPSTTHRTPASTRRRRARSIMLKLGDVCASASVKSMRPMTSITADTYSWNGYLRLNPGINAPIIITGNT